MSENRFSTSRSRHGREALYALTPFKIQNVEFSRSTGAKNYSLILAPIAFMKLNIDSLTWYKGYLDKFKVHPPMLITKTITKTVIQPIRLYTWVFKNNSPLKIIYQPSKGKKIPYYYSRYIEYSYDSLSNGHYCELGIVLLSSTQTCPLAGQCNLQERIDEKDKFYCNHYMGPSPYTAIYTVFPYVMSIYEEYSMGDKEEIISLPLFKMYYIPAGQHKVFINGVYFTPKKDKDMLPRLLFLNPTIGYRINNAPAIKFEFDYSKLKESIKEVLNSDDKVRMWIKIKYKLYIGSGVFNAYKTFYKKTPFTKLADYLLDEQKKQKLLKEIDNTNITDDEIEFASFLFLHSLAHIFLSWISTKYNYWGEGISYYITHPLLRNISERENKVAVYIVEEAIGGLGYLKSFKDEVKIDIEKFREFLLSYIDNSINCGLKIENEIENFFDLLQNPRKLQSVSTQAINPNFKNVIDDIRDAYVSFYYKNPNYKILRGVYPHINSIREYIVQKRKIDPYTRAKLDDILETGPHCWDGCPLCVMLERNCQFPIFNQPFLVSRELTRAILEKIDIDILSQILLNYQKMENPNIISSELSIGEGYRLFKALLKIAKEDIKLVSPYLSELTVNEIISIAKNNKKLHVKIITTNDPSDYHQESIRLFTEYIKRNENIEVRIHKASKTDLHAKELLIDNTLLMKGSVNFTRKGLTENIESADIVKDERAIKKFIEKFNSLWEESVPLK